MTKLAHSAEACDNVDVNFITCRSWLDREACDGKVVGVSSSRAQLTKNGRASVHLEMQA